MDWRHLIVGFLLIVAGYWLGGKYPGLLNKFTGGAVSG